MIADRPSFETWCIRKTHEANMLAINSGVPIQAIRESALLRAKLERLIAVHRLFE